MKLTTTQQRCIALVNTINREQGTAYGIEWEYGRGAITEHGTVIVSHDPPTYLLQTLRDERQTPGIIQMHAETRRTLQAAYKARYERQRAATTPEPLPLDPEHLRPVFNPHKPTQRVTSTTAEPLTLSLQFTGTPEEIDRNRQRIAGQLSLMKDER